MLGIESLEPRRLLSTGQLDLHFGDLGTAEFQYPVTRPTVPSVMATLADGRTLVVGDYDSSGTTTLALFTPDGTPDSTFGERGIRALPLPLDVETVLPAPDGSVYLVNRYGRPTVARLTPSLSLDPAWGDNGVLKLTLPSYWQFRTNAAVLLPDGSLFLAGDVADDIFYTRILPTGQLDTAFPLGYVRFRANRRYTDTLSSLTLLADGSLLASGSSAGDFLLWKITPNGKPVSGFGDADGMVVTDFGPTDDLASSLVVLPDGSIVAAGTSGGRFALARYTPGGKLLRTFGHRARITLDLDGPVERGAKLLLTPQGRLVLFGTTGNYFEHTLRVTAASFQPRGQLDRTFGQRGKQTFNFDSAPDSSTRTADALVDPSGGLLVTAAAYSDSIPDQIALFRVTSTGQLDPTFGQAGVSTIAFRDSAFISASAIVRQSNGKSITLASVSVWRGSSTISHLLLTRFNSDGSVDPTFGDSGSRLITELNPYNHAILVDSRDRIYVVARDAAQVRILRLDPDGRIDQSFGESGQASAPIDPDSGYNFQLAMQGDRLLFAADNQASLFVMRFDQAGVLDRSFAQDGTAQVASTIPSCPRTALTSLFVDPAGRITLVGRFHQVPPVHYGWPMAGAVALVRFTPTGQLDPSFADGGVQTTAITGTDNPFAATQLPDGRIAVATHSYGSGVANNPLLLFLLDGSLDKSFAGTGFITSDEPFQSIAYVDGKLVVAAIDYQTQSPTTNLERYNLDGTLDRSFANQGRLTIKTGSEASTPHFLPQPNGNLLLLFRWSQSLFLTQILSDTAPAPTAQVENRILRIRGTPGDDIIILRRSADHLSLLGDPVPYPLSEFSGIEIEGLAGNDLLDASQSPVPVTLLGGDGNDSLLGGAHADLLLANAGHDTLFGGSGNDTLHGNTGNDYLSGGPGADDIFGDEDNDQFHALDNRADLLHGGPGHDRATHDLADLLDQIESALF